jgi:hypothetical protein
VDACPGTACKFLQAGHERRRPYAIPEIGRPVRATRHGACDILVRRAKKGEHLGQRETAAPMFSGLF